MTDNTLKHNPDRQDNVTTVYTNAPCIMYDYRLIINQYPENEQINANYVLKHCEQHYL